MPGDDVGRAGGVGIDEMGAEFGRTDALRRERKRGHGPQKNRRQCEFAASNRVHLRRACWTLYAWRRRGAYLKACLKIQRRLVVRGGVQGKSAWKNDFTSECARLEIRHV